MAKQGGKRHGAEQIVRSDAEGDRAGKLLSPSRKRAAVAHLEAEFEVSERWACEVVVQPRSTQRYKPHEADDEGPLVRRMLELVRARPRFGYPIAGGFIGTAGIAGLVSVFVIGRRAESNKPASANLPATPPSAPAG